MKYLVILSLILQTIIQAQQFENKFDIREFELKKYPHLAKIQNINYPGDQTIDVNYYKLDLTITSNPNYIKGSVLVLARVDTLSIDSVFLDLKQNMIVDSIVLNDSIYAAFIQLDDKISITLNQTYFFNDIISVIIFYQGLPSIENEHGLLFGTHNGWPVIWTKCEPYYAKCWWPCKDTPEDKADSADIFLTVDTSLIPVSNGSLKEIINNQNGTHTYKWNESYPIAQYLISIAISNYKVYTNYYVYSPTDSMAITNYIWPEHYTTNNLNELNIIPEMLGVYSSLCGQYPFIREKFGHAECDASMEHQTITSIFAFDEGLMSHETAHQWFGDKITCKDWHHIWLNEGFAEFTACLWKEVKYGKELYDAYINSTMNGAKITDQSVWVEDITDFGNIFSLAVYYKGCVVLHMLRGVVGDSLFFKLLYDYATDPDLSYSVATTEDFQRVAETVYENDLDYFFSEWVYGKKYPKYKVFWNKEQVDSTWEIWLKIEQTVNVSPAYFTMPIEIKVNFADGDTTIKVFNNAQAQEFFINITKEPTSIVFDPNNWIMEDVLSIVLDVNDEHFPSKFSLYQNYPNPFNPITTIQYAIGSRQFVSLKVYDVLGNEVATLVDEEKAAGSYEVEFNPASSIKNPASGVYFYQLKAGDFVESKKMILIK